MLTLTKNPFDDKPLSVPAIIRLKNHGRDLSGYRFGRWHVREYAHSKPNLNNNSYKHYYSCECDCGTIRAVNGSALKSGGSLSCGCLQRERVSEENKRNPKPIGKKTHGLSGTRAYRTYRGMMARCYYKKNNNYARYGGKGVTVCPRWKNKKSGFINFISNMGTPPEGLTLDRINPFGNYEKSNCRWATPKEQAENTRKNWLKNHKRIKKAGVTSIYKEGKFYTHERKHGTDITGKRFGRWIAQYYIKTANRVMVNGKLNKKHFWLCRCDCGTERSVYAGALKSGGSSSCGCSRRV